MCWQNIWKIIQKFLRIEFKNYLNGGKEKRNNIVIFLFHISFWQIITSYIIILYNIYYIILSYSSKNTVLLLIRDIRSSESFGMLTSTGHFLKPCVPLRFPQPHKTSFQTQRQTEAHNKDFVVYLERSSWHGGRTLRDAGQTVCPAWRWHLGGTAAGWPTGPAQRSACPCAAWMGWFSRWQGRISWWGDAQSGDRYEPQCKRVFVSS